MNRGFAAFLALVLILAVGCNQKKTVINTRVGPKITKVISLSPSTTEIVGDLLMTDVLVGRTASCDYPEEVKSAVVVVSGTKPDFEKIAKIKPDMILYDAKLYTGTDLEKLKETGAKIFKLDANKIEDVMDFELQVGSEASKAQRASEIADTLYKAKQEAIAAAPAKKVRVSILSAGTGDYLGAGSESFLADVVKACGGEMVGPPGQVFAPFSPEYLAKGDPEIILVAGKAAGVLNDTRLASVSAVKSRPQRVYEVPESYLYRPGPKTVKLLNNLSNKITVYASQGAH